MRWLTYAIFALSVLCFAPMASASKSEKDSHTSPHYSHPSQGHKRPWIERKDRGKHKGHHKKDEHAHKPEKPKDHAKKKDDPKKKHRKDDKDRKKGKDKKDTTTKPGGSPIKINEKTSVQIGMAGLTQVEASNDQSIRFEDDEVVSSAFAVQPGVCATMGLALQGKGLGGSVGLGNEMCDEEILQSLIANYRRSCEHMSFRKSELTMEPIESPACHAMWKGVERAEALMNSRNTKTKRMMRTALGWLNPINWFFN